MICSPADNFFQMIIQRKNSMNPRCKSRVDRGVPGKFSWRVQSGVISIWMNWVRCEWYNVQDKYEEYSWRWDTTTDRLRGEIDTTTHLLKRTDRWKTKGKKLRKQWLEPHHVRCYRDIKGNDKNITQVPLSEQSYNLLKYSDLEAFEHKRVADRQGGHRFVCFNLSLDHAPFNSWTKTIYLSNRQILFCVKLE